MQLNSKMLRKVVGFWVLVLFIIPFTFAAENEGPQLPTLPTIENKGIPSIEESNRYLSAEATKAIKASQQELLDALIANQDANTLALDQEMRNLMGDIRMKIMLGVFGIMLLAQGLAAYFLVRSFKNNSYERFLEMQLGKIESSDIVETSPTARELQGVVAHQQQQWAPQDPSQSYAAQVGQQMASQQTMANQWQTEPAYAGAWESPVQVQQEYQQMDNTMNQFLEMQQPPYEEYQQNPPPYEEYRNREYNSY